MQKSFKPTQKKSDPHRYAIVFLFFSIIFFLLFSLSPCTSSASQPVNLDSKFVSRLFDVEATTDLVEELTLLPLAQLPAFITKVDLRKFGCAKTLKRAQQRLKGQNVVDDVRGNNHVQTL